MREMVCEGGVDALTLFLSFPVEPIRPIDPSAWVMQTNQHTGMCPPVGCVVDWVSGMMKAKIISVALLLSKYCTSIKGRPHMHFTVTPDSHASTKCMSASLLTEVH